MDSPNISYTPIANLTAEEWLMQLVYMSEKERTRMYRRIGKVTRMLDPNSYCEWNNTTMSGFMKIMEFNWKEREKLEGKTLVARARAQAEREKNQRRCRTPDDPERNERIIEAAQTGLSDGAIVRKLLKDYPGLTRDKVRGVRTRAGIPSAHGRNRTDRSD